MQKRSLQKKILFCVHQENESKNIIAIKLLFAEGKNPNHVMQSRVYGNYNRFGEQKHFWSDPVRMTNGDRFQ